MKFCAWTILTFYALKLAFFPLLVGRPVDWSWKDFWIAIVLAPVFVLPCGRILGWW